LNHAVGTNSLYWHNVAGADIENPATADIADEPED
jgi:hypothetical protein